MWIEVHYYLLKLMRRWGDCLYEEPDTGPTSHHGTTAAILRPSPGDRRSPPPTTSGCVERLESHANTCLDNYYDVHFSFVPSLKPPTHPDSSYSITNCQAYKLYRSDRNHTTDYVIHVCSLQCNNVLYTSILHTQYTWSWVSPLRSRHSQDIFCWNWRRPHISQDENAWQYNSPHGLNLFYNCFICFNVNTK